MDHIPIPESCKSQAREIPYLGLAPKYDKLGFDGFPERHGYTQDRLVGSYGLLQIIKPDWVESFIQEWFWFGLLDEFAKASNIIIDLDDFIIDSPSGSGKIITAAPLFEVYARRLAIRRLDIDAFNMRLEIGALARLLYSPTQEAILQIRDYLAENALEERHSSEAWAQATEKLSKPHSEADENGVTVSVDVLHQRVLACRKIKGELGSPQPELQLDSKIAKLVESIAQLETGLYMVMNWYRPVVRLDIIMSIDILCFTLAKINEVVLGDTIKDHRLSFGDKVAEIMCERNWCPSRIERLSNAGYTPLEYMASLLPCYDTTSHSGCFPRKCVKRPVAIQAMNGTHREDCNQKCSPVTIPEIQLIQMWNEGGIPGVRSAKNKQHGLFEVVNCDENPFIAISHVWSHGLGNPTINELPSCQVHFLCELVTQLNGEDTILWIDTLSVPIQAEAKRVSISKLRKVYSEASKVLVIDKDLMQVGSDRTEQMMQLLGSEWLRRLWTLQEGRLARELFIQFKESSVSASELMAVDPLLQFSDYIFSISSLLKGDLRVYFSTDQDPLWHFMSLVEDLAQRSVTVESDESICLATLLGISLENYDFYPTMADIYRALPNIPPDLLFVRQPRLQDHGLTWAPSTFLETDYMYHGTRTTKPGRLTEEGLLIAKDCLLLDKDLDFHGIKPNHTEIYIANASSGESFGIVAPNLMSPSGEILRTEKPRVIKCPAVICQANFNIFARDGSWWNTSLAVLVSRLFDRDGVTHCRYEMDLMVWNTRDEYKDFHQNMVRKSRGGVIAELSAELVEEKSFCIG